MALFSVRKHRELAHKSINITKQAILVELKQSWQQYPVTWPKTIEDCNTRQSASQDSQRLRYLVSKTEMGQNQSFHKMATIIKATIFYQS